MCRAATVAVKLHHDGGPELANVVNEELTSLNDWSTLLPLVDFTRFNTPGTAGITPRDLDRAWSAASPLERELTLLDENPAENLTDVVSRQLEGFRTVRELVLSQRSQTSQRTAALANGRLRLAIA